MIYKFFFEQYYFILLCQSTTIFKNYIARSKMTSYMKEILPYNCPIQ